MQSFQSCDACLAAAELRVSAVGFQAVTVAGLLQLVMSQVTATRGRVEREYVLLGQKMSLGKHVFINASLLYFFCEKFCRSLEEGLCTHKQFSCFLTMAV